MLFRSAAAHHLLLSHGWATEVLRRESPNADVGIVLNLLHVDAASDSPADLDAAREADGMSNRWFLDPLFHGEYPSDLRYEPPVREGDLQAIAHAVTSAAASMGV